jgi:hypothetical protein
MRRSGVRLFSPAPVLARVSGVAATNPFVILEWRSRLCSHHVAAGAGFWLLRTLTNLYNQRPTWLAQAHETLDAAVAAAYGWSDYTPAMPDDENLRRLLALNLERAKAP